MSLLIGWLVRGAVRSIIRSMTVKPASYEAYAAVTPGVLEVKLSTGGEQSLAFEQMFRLDKERVWANDDGDMFAALEAGWPQRVDGRPIHDWGDGMTLCDMTTVLWGQALRNRSVAVWTDQALVAVAVRPERTLPAR